MLWTSHRTNAYDPSTSSMPCPVPSKQAPTAIGELTVAVVYNICTTVWYSPYDCSTQYHIVIYGQCPPYSHRSHSYRSSIDHGWPTPSSHPHVFYGPCGYSTRVPYHVGPCRPLRPVTGLPGSDQRGVAQEKWSCGRPRPCLACGLCFLVLPVIWSVRHPSLPGDVIQDPDLDLTWNLVFSPSFQEIRPFPLHSRVSSTWNHPTTNRFPYGGRRHRHADGRSPTIVRHRNTLFRWIFRCVRHRNTVRWKGRTSSTIVVLSLRWLGKEFPSRTYRIYHGTPAYGTCRSSRLIAVYYGTMVPNPRGTWYDGTVPSSIGCRRRHMYQETVAIRQRPILVDPGNYLHAGINSLCSCIGNND